MFVSTAPAEQYLSAHRCARRHIRDTQSKQSYCEESTSQRLTVVTSRPANERSPRLYRSLSLTLFVVANSCIFARCLHTRTSKAPLNLNGARFVGRNRREDHQLWLDHRPVVFRSH